MIPADSLRAALDTVFRAPAYDWVDVPRGPALLRHWWEVVRRWLEQLQSGHPTAFRAFIISLAVILSALLLHGILVALITARRAAARGEPAVTPAAPRRTAAGYFREADQLAAAGRYGEAMRVAFVGGALELDRREILRFHPSKTPADYVREARLAPDERDALRTLVNALYAVAFGGAACPPEEYRSWRAALGGSWHAAAN